MQNQHVGFYDEQNEQSEDVRQIKGAEFQVHGEKVILDSGFAVIAGAKQDLTMNSSLAFGTGAGRDLVATDSLLFSAAANHDIGFKDSAAILLAARGCAQIENSAALLSLSREVSVQRGYIGVNIARKTILTDDSKVLLNTKQAAVFGVVFGIVFALGSWLLRRIKGGCDCCESC